ALVPRSGLARVGASDRRTTGHAADQPAGLSSAGPRGARSSARAAPCARRREHRSGRLHRRPSDPSRDPQALLRGHRDRRAAALQHHQRRARLGGRATVARELRSRRARAVAGRRAWPRHRGLARAARLARDAARAVALGQPRGWGRRLPRRSGRVCAAAAVLADHRRGVLGRPPSAPAPRPLRAAPARRARARPRDVATLPHPPMSAAPKQQTFARLRVDPERPDPRKLMPAVEALRRGEVIIYPTDTGYAFGCALSSAKGIDTLRRLKGLPPKHAKPLTMLVESLNDMGRYGNMGNQAFRVVRRLLPGPYTIVLQATSDVPRAMKNRAHEVGMRLPDHKICTMLVELLGEPLLTGS